ncbi:MAG: hypothetical protein HYU48_01850 [Candidatus Levybacteria bacterium]|nr:hypothetical protein [Candidatus Levybacteria bacterium]
MPQSTHYHHLKEKWTVRHRQLQKNLLEKHADSLHWLSQNSKQLMVSSLGGLLLLAAPGKHLLLPPAASGHEIAASLDKSVFLSSDLSSALPEQGTPLTPEQEKNVIEILKRNFGLSISAEENEIRLERNYGRIGAEQHLARYPGDTMSTHFDNEDDARRYWSSGMAPGLGAWGYFVHGQQMTQEDVQREKYYLAIQTFLAPGYNQNVKKFSEFLRYKKMLVVNPDNGKAMVAVIGDAGPAQWTRKHLGGSPEVMHYLERVDGAHVGSVVYFFIDDPENKVPLGPISIVK